MRINGEGPVWGQAVWKRAQAKNVQNYFLYYLLPTVLIRVISFRLTKSRTTFYAQIKCRGFHTTSGMGRRRRRATRKTASGSTTEARLERLTATLRLQKDRHRMAGTARGPVRL